MQLFEKEAKVFDEAAAVLNPHFLLQYFDLCYLLITLSFQRFFCKTLVELFAQISQLGHTF